MKPTLWLGIDPGLAGGVGAIYPDGRVQGFYTPTRKIKQPGRTPSGKARYKTKYDIPAMVEVLRPFLSAYRRRKIKLRVVLEEVTALRKGSDAAQQGVVSSFNFGAGYGIWLGIIAGAGLYDCLRLVRPNIWRPLMVGPGTDKKVSRSVASRLWPQMDFALVKSADIAEGLLLAEFGRRKDNGLEMRIPRPSRKGVKPKKKRRRRATSGLAVAFALAPEVEARRDRKRKTAAGRTPLRKPKRSA